MATSLPTVLAGPVVRPGEPEVCGFWVALKDPADAVTATVWNGVQMAGATGGTVVSGNPIIGTATVKTRRFGQHLHVAMIAIKLPDSAALIPGAVYSYDIRVGSNGLSQLG